MNYKGSIGIFDSGIGGVTVLKEIIKLLPLENYIYVSDSKNNPYGDKEEDKIKDICDHIVEFLLNKNCKIIVIACNTASAIASSFLREKYPHIIFIAIEPAYKMVYDFAYQEPTLIMATKGTMVSEKFHLLLTKYNNGQTYLLSCQGLADLIEKGDQKAILNYLQVHLKKYQGKVKNVVLGCTHYPLIKKEINKVLKDVQFFDGSLSVAKHLATVLTENNLLNKEGGKIEFIDTSNSKEKEKRFYDLLNL